MTSTPPTASLVVLLLLLGALVRFGGRPGSGRGVGLAPRGPDPRGHTTTHSVTFGATLALASVAAPVPSAWPLFIALLSRGCTPSLGSAPRGLDWEFFAWLVQYPSPVCFTICAQSLVSVACAVFGCGAPNSRR